jgi:signal transduction histidine kinase
MGVSSFRGLAPEFRAVVPFGKAVYRERALAAFRILLALSFILLFRFVAPLAGYDQRTLHLVFAAYLIFSLSVFARLCLTAGVSSRELIAIHASDIVWPSLICLFTGCANSPFFVLFVFALLAVPYRRKALETLLLGVSSVVILLAENLMASAPLFASLHLLTYSPRIQSFMLRACILMVLAGFLAYSAYWNQREQQAFATRSILRRLRSDAAFQNNLREILPALLSIFEAKQVVLVLRNSSTWRVFQWGTADPCDHLPIFRDIPVSEEERYFWPMPMGATSIACARNSRGHDWLATMRDGSVIPSGYAVVPGPLLWNRPFKTLFATALQFGSEWSGRLFLVDPACGAGRKACLRLLQQVVDEVGPAVYNFYLWRHTSIRVRAIERQRIARDLHDGVIQSLIATELHLEVLRRKSLSQPEAAVAIEQAQDSLRNEVRKIRGEIERLRSSATPRRVVPCLADMLQTFQRQTGIVASFACNVQEQQIPQRIFGDLTRIVEEALSNVRRHSGARSVDVRLTSAHGRWEIVIQDDGRGFGFSGRLSSAELEAARLGPRVIRERVQSMNGELALESWPNRGARVEISFAAG